MSQRPSSAALGEGRHTPQPRFIVQDKDNRRCLEYFLNRIQAAHFQTLSTAPTILHWDSAIGDLSPWKWPVDLATGYRVVPSELEAHRSTHHFRAPSCLCARIDEASYSESRIGLVHVPIKLTAGSSLNGEYTAECATGRCGYLVCLERFYILPVLHVMGYPTRGTPIAPNTFNYNVTRDIFSGLQQVMPIQSVHTRGIKRDRVEEPYSRAANVHHALSMIRQGTSKEKLYDLLIECCLCQAVVLKCCFPHDHHCTRKLKFQHTELDITRPIHPKRVGYPRLRMPRSEDDDTTDVETDDGVESDFDTEFGIEIDQLISDGSV
ncbi:hypothetical protein BKA70DRAFT_1438176 [Coprinopsis sp. MPI-PUGE-AT-0042]|nr:hypothetical protein BKA70DRAFT_1438176 [Coprinopsis sp. MPI-PUGE-AT-0042]